MRRRRAEAPLRTYRGRGDGRGPDRGARTSWRRSGRRARPRRRRRRRRGAPPRRSAAPAPAPPRGAPASSCCPRAAAAPAAGRRPRAAPRARARRLPRKRWSCSRCSACCSCCCSLGRLRLLAVARLDATRQPRVDARTRAALTPGGSLSRTPRPRSCSAPTPSEADLVALRLDPAGPRRPGPPTDRRALDPARPAHRDPGPRRRPDQRGLRARRPAARDPDRRALTGIPSTTSCWSTSRASRADRRARRRDDRQPDEDHLEQFDGHPWRFGRGRLHLDGRHALAYARVRENTPTPPTTTSRADCASSACCRRSPRGLGLARARCSTCRRVGDALGKPLTTDLSANDLMALGWRQLRASSTLHCRLGGTITTVGGAASSSAARRTAASSSRCWASPRRCGRAAATRSAPAAPDSYEPERRARSG